MKTSTEFKALPQALKEFQAVAVNAFKGKKGYGYNYSPIDVILKENRPLLAKFGLSHIQSQEFDSDIITVTTRLIHESGEWIETTAVSPYTQLKGMNSYQSIGSGITYLRRYSLSAALGIASDDDEDAHGEQEVTATPQYVTASKATLDDKKRYWGEFVSACNTQEVDPMNFLEEQIDMTDKNEVHNTVIKWLRNYELLQQQLLVFKQGK